MSDKTLTDEGYLAVPSNSNIEVQMEPENTINEDELSNQPSESANLQPTRERPLKSGMPIQRHLGARRKNKEHRKGNPSTKMP